MKSVLQVLLCVLTVYLPVLGGEFQPFDGPKPIAVVLVSDPWLMVIGSDTPNFVLYEDGQLIRLKVMPGDRAVYFWKQLSEVEFNEIKTQIRACGPFPSKPGRISLTEATDQPETSIMIDFGESHFLRSVYGLSWPEERSVPGLKGKPRLSKETRSLTAVLAKFTPTGMQEWKPRYIEAMVWPFEYAPDESIKWPKDWPGLSSESAMKRRDAYSIFLPGSQLERVSAFLATRKEKGAVEIDGKKWAVSVRLTFPSEPVWRKAFRAIE